MKLLLNAYSWTCFINLGANVCPHIVRKSKQIPENYLYYLSVFQYTGWV